MAETGKGDSKGEQAAQGANIEAATGDGGGFSAPKGFEDLLLRKLAAIRTLSRNMSFTDVDIRYPVFAMTVLTDDNAHPIAKAAAAALLDCCCPGWRDTAEPEILGSVVQRDDPKVAQWRREVLQRDNHTCQFCGSTKNLHAHHILRWVDNPEARLIVSNGITYCGACHKTVPMGGLCG